MTVRATGDTAASVAGQSTGQIAPTTTDDHSRHGACIPEIVPLDTKLNQRRPSCYDARAEASARCLLRLAGRTLTTGWRPSGSRSR